MGIGVDTQLILIGINEMATPTQPPPGDGKNSPDNTGVPEPKVNEQFWYDLSKTLVEGAVERIDKSIEKVGTLLEWAYGVYTGAAILTIDQKGIESIPLLVFLALPYLLLLLALWNTNVGGFPIQTNFDPNSYTWIRDEYIRVYNLKQLALSKTKKVSFVALTVMGLALVSCYVISQRQTPETTENYIAIKYLKKEKTKSKLSVTGHLPSDSLFNLTIEPFNKTIALKSGQYDRLNTKSGDFLLEYEIDSTATHCKVKVTWKEDETLYSIQKDTDDTNLISTKTTNRSRTIKNSAKSTNDSTESSKGK